MRNILLASCLGAALLWGAASSVDAQSPAPATATTDALVEGFAHVETGSVADAIEQLYGQRTYLPHSFRPLDAPSFVGRAVTVQLKRQEHHEGAPASQGMIDAIDNAGPGSVYVMQLEQGEDFAGIGGLMATAMKARGFTGAVIDGGVRDVGQITKLRFPVFSRSVVPSTTINHYRFAGANVPVSMSGVRVNAGDIILADADGVVVVPKDHAQEVLKKAQELDFSEHAMIPYIEKFRSLREAIAKFGRI